MKERDFSRLYDKGGYKIYYKGKLLSRCDRYQPNEIDNKNAAERDIIYILGGGVNPEYYDRIREIDKILPNQAYQGECIKRRKKYDLL